MSGACATTRASFRRSGRTGGRISDELVAANLTGLTDARTGDPVDAETIEAVVAEAARTRALAEEGRRLMAGLVGGAR